MQKHCFKNRILATFFSSLMLCGVQAAKPVWTFEPLTATTVAVPVTGSATVQYRVTNQSHKSHTLKMKPVQGIAASGCTSPLGYHQSCPLTLTVTGSSLKGDVLGGPILCDQINPIQCYQPSQVNSLVIRLTQAPPVQQYTITSSAGSNGSISPNGSQAVNSGGSLTLTATPDLGYGVRQWIVDGSLAQTGGATYQLTNISANHTVNVTFDTVTLTPSVSTLGLSVNCPAASMSPDCAQKNDALTGTPRQITITNTGLADATNAIVSHSGLPSDTLVSPSSCGTISANGGQCVITVTPGPTASSNASSALCTTGVQPEGSVSVTVDGGVSVPVDTYVLSYGCIYQGGFIYSVDDATPNTGSIGGKTAAVTDTYPGQTTSIIGTPDWGGMGIDISSTLYDTEPQGANDGSANSEAIIQALTSVPLSDYAAGLCSLWSVDAAGASPCTAPSTCYTNWYLPAACELGLTSGAPCTSVCTSGSTNIQQQLFESTLISSATLGLVEGGIYCSSTENSLSPGSLACMGLFSSGGSYQDVNVRYFRLGVRCSRALTQ